MPARPRRGCRTGRPAGRPCRGTSRPDGALTRRHRQWWRGGACRLPLHQPEVRQEVKTVNAIQRPLGLVAFLEQLERALEARHGGVEIRLADEVELPEELHGV